MAVGNVAAPTQATTYVASTQGGGGNGGSRGSGGSGGTGGLGGAGSSGADVLKASHSGLGFAVPAGNRNDRAPVTQQTCTGAAGQLWRTTSGKGGTAYVNAASGMCLDLTLDNQPVAPGAQVYQFTCNNGTNQAWTAKPQGSRSALDSAYNNLCLGVYGGNGAVGNGAVGWICNGAADRIFNSGSSRLRTRQARHPRMASLFRCPCAATARGPGARAPPGPRDFWMSPCPPGRDEASSRRAPGRQRPPIRPRQAAANSPRARSTSCAAAWAG
ncbi:RICIN domain-containing protein [Methylobacterium currus]|uniref:RICIN domain-containing protein n=1 Tax=Methylobacterium currus TaxID=2051553 RepID=UPI0013DEF87A|nr:RICIN domain-containing protein [Methylobacterium currus]